MVFSETSVCLPIPILSVLVGWSATRGAENLPCIALLPHFLLAVGRDLPQLEVKSISAYRFIFPVFHVSWSLICPPLFAIRSLTSDWTPLFLPTSLIILDATELHPLQMIEQIFHQRRLKRVETHRLQTYHWSNSTARPKFSSRPMLLKSSSIFFFFWTELGQANAEICDGPNTCNLC